ncbi:hypothetical protein FXE65_00325 [Vibrio cholerae]|uniref:metallophosphoesterase family protein n=1 Tax=Vibrio cholerae TaxID=666 RepID=UPI0011D86A50|nr:metallophosphoesterase [Vibrio cholerae]EGR1835834.1 hypothetical protein [Vibrio cholerae]EGR4363019.1 hypothetical protein [Vibrio cholerae]ELJ8527714.1 metallophosphoesterase family protein [Vibrio cholerae]TXX80913.1 hypothetical protein FXE95_04595 [Vibrio cholerae]TXX84748.1 hypothetical protein FXE94_04340 [Vibrio cholerae]
MKVTVFSDVHGDIYSLETLFKLEYSDCYICLGDLVGYGPHSNKCIDLAIDKCGIDNVILGNHEEMYLIGAAHESCSELAKRFFNISFRQYTTDKRLNNFKKKIILGGAFDRTVSFQHTLERRHIYPNSIVQSIDENICFIGHSHVQFSKDINLSSRIINVGSLGQNRMDKNIANYVNYYPEKSTIELRSFYSNKYNLVRDMRMCGYEDELLKYYE